eukprot:6206546-Pleurochrysis_carterae.AAC.7
MIFCEVAKKERATSSHAERGNDVQYTRTEINIKFISDGGLSLPYELLAGIAMEGKVWKRPFGAQLAVRSKNPVVRCWKQTDSTGETEPRWRRIW